MIGNQQTPSLPKLNLEDQHSSHGSTKPKRKLGLVLFASVILFAIALIGGGVFMYFKFFSSAPTIITKPDPADASTVKNVQWVAPEIPSSYVLRSEITDFATTNVYEDNDAGCKITATVQPSAKEQDVAGFLLAEAEKVAKMDSKKPGEPYFVKDEDAVHEYEFESVEIQQKVTAADVGFDKLNSVMLYKQFNYQTASLSYSCKLGAWDSKKAELDEVIKKFMVKTERAT